jgi:hypothetical protein
MILCVEDDDCLTVSSFNVWLPGSCREIWFGPGGIGKTQVVLSDTNSVLQTHPDHSVLWVPALSVEAFEQAYGDIAPRLGISTSANKTEDNKELFVRYLNTMAAGRSLLIVDNADNLSIFDGHEDGFMQSLPESPLGFTMLTTRDRQIAQNLVGADEVAERMDHAEAVAVLRRSLTEETSARTKLLWLRSSMSSSTLRSPIRRLQHT